MSDTVTTKDYEQSKEITDALADLARARIRLREVINMVRSRPSVDPGPGVASATTA